MSAPDPIALEARRKRRRGEKLTEEEATALRAYQAAAKRKHDQAKRDVEQAVEQ